MVYMTDAVVVKDRLLFYYSGYNTTHGDITAARAGIGVATLRPDGYVSIEPDGEEGSLTTKPFRIAGSALEVNADAARGAILVEVLDERGWPVAGFRSSECRAIAADGLRQKVSWKEMPSLGSLKCKSAALRFVLKRGAKLYAFRVAE
jgi:hypothetical protein